jgi:acyl carrier protein phosphodiesterase
MNFLAHLYLSGDNPEILTGNFIGDFVKGKNAYAHLSPIIVKGVDLHRSIDSFTDSHAIVAKSKKRLWPTYRHYAGVIVDIYYDHFLAKNWNNYHKDLLPDYADYCYGILQARVADLPPEVQYMLPYMIKGNWLVNYAKLEGIQRSLSGMARRTTFVSKMEEAVNDLELYYEDFKNEFESFFPQLDAHCKKWKMENLKV